MNDIREMLEALSNSSLGWWGALWIKVYVLAEILGLIFFVIIAIIMIVAFITTVMEG